VQTVRDTHQLWTPLIIRQASDISQFVGCPCLSSMSEENRYDSHPIAVPSHYSIHVPQTNGGVLYPSVAPQTPGNQYRYRAEGPEYRYNMNGVAGGPQPNHHPHQPFLYGGAMPSVSRGPPQWQQFYATSDTEQARRNLSHDTAQSTPAPYPPTEMADSWSKAPTSFVRSQHSQNQNFSHSHNMGGHSSNYNLHHHSQSYSRPLHNPLEPSAAPSPPNPYPGSPRTPISSQQTVGTNGIPAPQPFRQSSQSRAPLAVSTAASDNSIYRSEPSSSHANSYPNSCQSSPSTNSLLPRQGRNSMVSPLGPPVNPPSNYVENSNHCSFVRRDSDGFGRHPNVAENDGKGPGSVPKTTQSHYSQPEYDSEDDKQVKRERHSRSPSVSMSPRTARADRPNDRSPSFSGSATKESKSGLELPGKKKGMPVFRGSDGTDYYENEPVPPGVEIPEGWQIGTGKQTKGLLLPRVKDGIQVNPEWGFTAGGRARQRLPQACKNCRAKKIRCV
jgi:hypothetical protein